MGVYIKGMEMPTSCLECRLYNDPWCMAKNRNQWRTAYNRPPNGERQNDCPLTPVPPHGRLIDADALLTYDKPIGKMMMFGGEYVYTQTAIDNAPTIIPAEENHNDD